MSDQSDSPRRRRRQPQRPPQPQGSVARGAILVVVAVVIGLVLLRDDDSSVAQVAVGADVTDDGADGGDGEDTSTSSTTTTLPPRPPSQVKVLVANGSSVNGAAGATSDDLEALGYVTGTPTNAERVPATVVYYTPGFQAEAEALAVALNAPSTAVAALPTVAPVDDLQLSNVLVVIGPDLAQGG